MDAAPRRDVVTVSGTDARSYLHGQLAVDVASLPLGASRWSLVLAPNGKVTALARLSVVDESRFELDVEPGFGAALAARLERFRIRVDVAVELAESIAVDPATLVGWWEVADGPRRWADDLGTESPSVDEVETRRVAAGWPAMGVEITPEQTIPSETGVVGVAVTFGKGCYPGQELVERMDSRGASAPRQLVRLAADGRRVGDAVLDEAGADVGRITSVAGEHALALVKRSSGVGTPVADAS